MNVHIVGYALGQHHATVWNGIPTVRDISIAEEDICLRTKTVMQGYLPYATVLEMIQFVKFGDIVVMPELDIHDISNAILAANRGAHVICERLITPIHLQLMDSCLRAGVTLVLCKITNLEVANPCARDLLAGKNVADRHVAKVAEYLLNKVCFHVPHRSDK